MLLYRFRKWGSPEFLKFLLRFSEITENILYFLITNLLGFFF